ncbi:MULTISPECIES: hypothetical protein [unclassified Spirillospora]|uniref:hypothetical protein n=1 Tax=unclassified Spirillospora TaxID=2642701 RepID=UPI00371D6166
MTTEIVIVSLPLTQIVEFGGLPVLDAVPTQSSWNLRRDAAKALDRLGAAVPPHLEPDEDRDATRLAAALGDPGSVAWWLPLVSWEDDGHRYADDHLEWLLRQVPGEAITTLVIGGTVDHLQVEDDGEEPVAPNRGRTFSAPAKDPSSNEEALPDAVQALARRAADLPNLRALYVGEIDTGQQHHCEDVDVAALLEAFPRLEELTACAFLSLRIRVADHARLRRLALHGALMDDEVIGLAGSALPALEHLEVWSQEQMADEPDPGEREAFGLLFGSETMPRLRHLGLREFTFADEMVEELAASPLLPRLHTLDLSRSAVTDAGARTLLTADAFRSLTRLDLRRHYMSAEMVETVRQTFTTAGVDIDTGDGGHLG